MIDLNAEKVISAIKIIDLDTQVSAQKIMVVFVFEINSGNIYIEIALINQDTIVLFQIIMLGLEIRYFKIVIFFLVCSFINLVIKDKYFWIFYQKFW